MALVISDRVRVVTTTTGTGDVTLGSGETGFQSFGDVLSDGDTTYYAISARIGSDWEVGVGTYTSATTSLSRDTILDSSNSGSAVNLSSGSKDVFIVIPASKTVYEDASNVVNIVAAIASGNMEANSMTIQGSTVSTLDDATALAIALG